MKIIEKINSFSTAKIISVIVLVGFLTFANMLGNSFVWDDEEMVVKNFPLFQIKNIPALFKQATFFSGGSALSGWFYRPLVMMSFLLSGVIFGTSPVGFHLIQLFFHLTAASLLFLVLLRLFEKKSETLAKPIAFLLSLIFVVHPAHIESVSYIASVAEPLYTSFILLAFLLIIQAKELQKNSRRLFLVGFLLLLALLTKEGAIVFIPIAFLYLFLFDKKKLKKWITPLTLGFGVYIIIRSIFFGFQTQRPDFFSPIAEASFIERIQTLPLISFSFIKTFFLPIELSVSQHMVVKNISFELFWIPFLIVLLLFGLVLFFIWRSKSKLACLFLFWIIISFLLVSNLFLSLDMTFAERWLYVVMIGILGLMGTLLLEIKNLKKFMVPIFVLGIIVTAMFSIRTIIRNTDWKDGMTLYSHDIKIMQNSFDLENNLGVELFRHDKKEEALEHFQRSVELQPKWTISTNNLGATYEALGDLEKAQEYYKKSVELGNYYLAHENLAQIFMKTQQYEEAVNFLEKALRKFPNNEVLNRSAAIAYYQLNEQSLALSFSQRAYRLNPNNLNLYIYQTIRDNKELQF